MGDLTPVSERSDDDELDSQRAPALNFSRPRPATTSRQRLQRDSSESEASSRPTTTASLAPTASRTSSSSNVRAINAFHDPSRDSSALPTEPRFSLDSDRAGTDDSSEPTSAASEFAWDGRLGELRSRRRPDEYDQNQRYTKSPSTHSIGGGGGAAGSGGGRHQHSRSTTSTSTASNHSSGSRRSNLTATVSASEEPLLPISEVPPRAAKVTAEATSTVGTGSGIPAIPDKAAHHIIKRTDVDQQSERISLSSDAHPDNHPHAGAGGAGGAGAFGGGDWEDAASHHTMSVAGDAEDGGDGDMGDAGKPPPSAWSSSDFDTSGLSSAEIRKLRKKGINPALYAEMKAARKGKGKWVGPLVGNTYIG